MKSLFNKLIAALIVIAALAGCATIGEPETVMDYLDRTYDTSSGD